MHSNSMLMQGMYTDMQSQARELQSAKQPGSDGGGGELLARRPCCTSTSMVSINGLFFVSFVSFKFKRRIWVSIPVSVSGSGSLALSI
jgi:hypothetical protein